MSDEPLELGEPDEVPAWALMPPVPRNLHPVLADVLAEVARLKAEPEPEYPPPHMSAFDHIKLHMGFASQFRSPDDVPPRWAYVAAIAIVEAARLLDPDAP